MEDLKSRGSNFGQLHPAGQLHPILRYFENITVSIKILELVLLLE